VERALLSRLQKILLIFKWILYLLHAVGKSDKQLCINSSPTMEGNLLEFSNIPER